MRRVEYARGNLGDVECAPDEIEAARSVADMQMDNARLARHQATNVRVGSDTEKFIERRLTRAMIADGEFPDTDDSVNVCNVAANGSRERDRREVISSGVTPCREAVGCQAACTHDQFASGSRDVVGAKNANCSCNTGSSVVTEKGCRNPGLGSGLSTSTRQVRMTIDESGNNNEPVQFNDGNVERRGDTVEPVADPEDLLAADEDVANPDPVRIEDVRVAKQGEHDVIHPQPPRRAENGSTADTAPLLSGTAQRPEHVPSRATAALATKGWLIPIGGRLESPSIVARFVKLCGGADARIVIVPLASKFDDAGEYYGRMFAEHGATTITTLTVRTRRGAFDQAARELIEQATGVFFTGGNQLKLSTVLVGTPLGECLRKRHASGMHVAGTSAGAAILSRHMIAFGEEGRMPRAAMVTTSAGLGFTDRYIVDQHFRERDRLGRLLTAVAYNPGLFGLGVDEDTAAFIAPDDVIHVEGTGVVTFVDPTELNSEAILEAVPGMPLDLPGMQVHIIKPNTHYEYDVTAGSNSELTALTNGGN